RRMEVNGKRWGPSRRGGRPPAGAAGAGTRPSRGGPRPPPRGTAPPGRAAGGKGASPAPARVAPGPPPPLGRARPGAAGAGRRLADEAAVLLDLRTSSQHVAGADREQQGAGDDEAAARRLIQERVLQPPGHRPDLPHVSGSVKRCPARLDARGAALYRLSCG